MESLCRVCQYTSTVLFSRGVSRYALSLTGMMSTRWNSHRAAIAKTNRKVYQHTYPTVVVNTDGSTFRIRYSEPRKILKMPVDVNLLHFDEKKIRLARYQPKKKAKIEDDLDDNFDANRYKRFWNKRKL